MKDIFTDIKKQSKEIINNNAILFVLSIILYSLNGMVAMTKPIWASSCSKLSAFIITEIIMIVLFPLTLGFIRVLFQVKEEQSFKAKDILYIYKSPRLFLNSVGLIFIANVLIDIVNFINTIFLNSFIMAHNLPFLNILLIFVLGLSIIIFSLYLFLTKYIFDLKPELRLLQIIKQSIELIRGQVLDLILLYFSLLLWFAPSGILIAMSIQSGKLTLQYFIYYGIYFLYTGSVSLYVELTLLLFAQKIINLTEPLKRMTNTISESEEEIGGEYQIDDALIQKQDLFENNQLLSQEKIVFNDTAEDINTYNVDSRYDTYEFYYFLKEYGKIRNLFIKTYDEAIYYYGTNTAEKSIKLNNNKFRLIVSINKNDYEYEIRFELFINS